MHRLGSCEIKGGIVDTIDEVESKLTHAEKLTLWYLCQSYAKKEPYAEFVSRCVTAVVPRLIDAVSHFDVIDSVRFVSRLNKAVEVSDA